jgi:glycine/D-amino acid oxidase-like deaminating enzyme
VDPDVLIGLMRQSLDAWRALEATWPGGVGLLPLDFHGSAQARVNPLRAITRLAAGLPCIATGVAASGVVTRADRIDALLTTLGEFRPRSVVFATGTVPRLEGLRLDVPSGEVKGHIAVSQPTDLQPGQAIPGIARVIEARVIEDGRILVGGSVDVGDDERVVRPEVADRLWDELAEVWPQAREYAIDYRWACFRPAHPDHMPVIDRVPGLSNAWFSSGHYKTGILLAPATGSSLASWIVSGSAPPEVSPFSAGRLTPA